MEPNIIQTRSRWRLRLLRYKSTSFISKNQYKENGTYSGIKCVLGIIIFSKWYPLIKKTEIILFNIVPYP